MPPDSKETELVSSDEEASRSVGKNTGIVLVPCRTWKCIPMAISYFRWCGYFQVPRVSFVTTDEFSVRVTKLIQGLVSYQITAYLSTFNLF